MASKILISALIVSLLLISACVQAPEKAAPSKPEPEKAAETEKQAEEGVEETAALKEMTPEVKEFLSIADKKVKSLRYSYKGPETNNFLYKFAAKGSKVKYILNPDYKAIDIDTDAYDAVYLNNELETAQAYCDNRQCAVKGKKTDLDYDKMHIPTPLEWLDKVAYAEKVGEELIDSRFKTWKLSTDNAGTMWVDSYSGVPLRVEFEGNIFEFKNVLINDVTDEEVTPKN